MTVLTTLLEHIQMRAVSMIEETHIELQELTLIVNPPYLRALCLILRDEPEFLFHQLIDVCGIDYLHYGRADWQTDTATSIGFSRGVERGIEQDTRAKPYRFAVVYHLLSLEHNMRVRLRVPIHADNTQLMIDSVSSLWRAANWFE